MTIPDLDECGILEWWRVVAEGKAQRREWTVTVCPWTRFGWNSVRLVDAALQVGIIGSDWDWWPKGIALDSRRCEVTWTSRELRRHLEKLSNLLGLEHGLTQ
jgi:hypothetical protein